MAGPQSPRFPHLDPPRPRYRGKEYTFALLAAILVLAYYFHSREGSGLQPPTPEALQNEILATPGKDAVAAVVTATPPSTSIGETGLDIVYPGHSSGSSPGSSSTGTGSANPSALDQTAPAADRPTAVIIESDMTPNLIPLMLHFTSVLGPSWGMILFTLKDRWVEPLSPAFQRHLESGRIEVRFLQADTELTDSRSVSRFLTSPWIWEQLASARRVLLFQSDSVLCSKSEAAVDDYFKYDFAGAPIAPAFGAGFNGGLSVRNPRTFLQITREVDFEASGHEFEDQFFYQELTRRDAAMPSEDVAKTFAVETIYYETPLGYHQPQRWQAANMQTIEEWCPEVKMLIGRRAQ